MVHTVELVLGMVRLKDLTTRDGTGTSVGSFIRDFHRIQMLEQTTGVAVFAISSAPVDLPHPYHVNGSFNHRGAKAVEQAISKVMSAEAKIRTIYLDYFRFPTAYFAKAFVESQLFVPGGFLDSLVNVGLMTSTCQVFVPNSALLKEHFQDLRSRGYSTMAIAADDNPLFFTSAVLDVQHHLTGYRNELQIRPFDDAHPFVVITPPATKGKSRT